MSRTRYVAHCQSCDATLPKLMQLGESCPSCTQALSDGRRTRTPYAGEELIGAYGSGPPEAPWREIKDGPLKGQNVVPSLRALKNWGNRTGTVWQ